MGTPAHLISLIRGLYSTQRAAVRTEHGDTNWFSINKGVRQGCILSPRLFNLYTEHVMRRALEGFDGGINISGRKVCNLRYADDTTLIATTEDECREL